MCPLCSGVTFFLIKFLPFFSLFLQQFLFIGTQCTASSGSVFVEEILPGCQNECKITMYLEPLEKESVSFLSRIFVRCKNVCVCVCVGRRRGCQTCMNVHMMFGQSSYACNSSSATRTLCLDNVKSTVNVLCSCGHQICVLAPLAILVMSQLILVPHGLNVPLSRLQSHFTADNFFLFSAIVCSQFRTVVQNFTINCEKHCTNKLSYTNTNVQCPGVNSALHL